MGVPQKLGMRALGLFSFTLLGLAEAQQNIKEGPRGSGTAFKKCGGTFFGGSERCFEVTLRKFQVQIGAQGTDDDVRVKVCADDQKTCCTTPPLKKTFSDDWSSNDLEQWGPDYFGECKGKKFLIRRGLNVTIEKEGKSALAVTSLFIEADGVTADKKLRSPERFDCGRLTVSKNSAKSKTNFCGTSPYSYERVKEVKVAIGPDGTNDDVRAEFCSDVDSVCCRTKPLKTLLRDDWSKNDDEEWGESDLGPCKTTLYKVRDGIRFTLMKNGKDDLQVNKLVLGTENLRGAKFSYDCKDFKLASQGTQCVEGYDEDEEVPRVSVSKLTLNKRRSDIIEHDQEENDDDDKEEEDEIEDVEMRDVEQQNVDKSQTSTNSSVRRRGLGKRKKSTSQNTTPSSANRGKWLKRKKNK